MKKTILFLFSLAGGLLLAQGVWAQEKIDNYGVDIKMNIDSSINITERIDYNFGDLQRHGIYRDIPYIYQDGLFTRHTDISQVSVVDETGHSYGFSVSNSGNDKRIKIGDANAYVTGLKTYVISYKVVHPYIFQKDYDQLYWDVVGGAWTVPIISSVATVWLPQAIDYNNVQAKCYTGSFGSDTECSGMRYLFENDNSVKLSGLIFQQNQISPEGILTVLVSLPKGIIIEPSSGQKVANFLKENAILFLPIISLLVMFILWYKRGRDPKGRGNIIVQYDVPDNLSPAEVGSIVDENVHSQDISAEIVYLAIQGYLKITRIEKSGILKKSADYLLEKLKDEDNSLPDYEQEILANLFHKASSQEKLKDYQLEAKAKVAVLLSDLDEAYQWRKIVDEKIYESVSAKGYFVKNPKQARAKYTVLLFVALGVLVSVLQGISGNNFNGFALYISIIVSMGIIAVFGWHMPRRTAKGVLTKEYILGLKEYLSVAEKDRLEFHNAPEKNPQHFEALLPYAMVLGVEKQWAKQFEGIYQGNPNWCVGFYAGNFMASDFTNSLNSFGAQAKSSFSPPTSSGAGGFAGGGGGGGGGGSW